MIDYNGKPAAFCLQTFSDAINGIQVHRRNRTNHDVRKIKLCKRDLLARQPFVAGMTSDMNDDIRFEHVAQIFVKRQVLMMRWNDVRTMQTVRICLPSALRLWTDEDAT